MARVNFDLCIVIRWGVQKLAMGAPIQAVWMYFNADDYMVL